ncbi:hypothetical protein GCM10010112_81860 [Actinoplanes lobatus]|uniref:Uncharacterized protein n=1 Tax=Actinoplanes lobatus TaxID=113568 RepID=A0A7W7MJM0_9ACTN|nr:hypothetical protein [Actinoplanes lobatus]MBB4752598.1 hypothetical protein [Actinoplanes lobatus]GGN93529.1 hypothetical protein GCM10010112_81860 [Actinoplanes lobatus]GIE44734.1 hypothetical protein Alo02nite_76320 [Actinoplanes lobatus]
MAFGLPLVLLASAVAAPMSASAAALETDCSTLAQPTQEAAVQVAGDCDAPVEITEATNETTRAWALPDGKIRQEISAAPVRVQKGGEWVATDLTLVQQADGSIAPKAHPAELVISGATSESGVHELAILGEGDDQVAMGWTGPLPAPTLSADKATYPEVMPGVDLVVQATTRGVESFYIVKTPTAASQVTTLTVPIVGDDVTSHHLGTDGQLKLLDKSKKPVAGSPTPLMWDAQTDPRTGDPTNVVVMESDATTRKATDVSAQAEPIEAAGVNLTITPDADFFNDPDTVYPVTIDPTITYDDPTWDTWVRDGVTTDLSTTTYLEIGASGGKASRSMVNFNVSALKGAIITDATVGFYNYMSASCERLNWEIWQVGGSNTETRWTNQPTWHSRSGVASTVKGGPTCTAPGFIWVNAKPFFQEAANVGRNVGYLGVRASDETSNLTQKRFYSQNYSDTTKSPTATVTYEPGPTLSASGISKNLDNTAFATSCVTGASRPVVNTFTPQFFASFTHPTLPSFSAEFEYTNLSGAVLGTETVGSVPVGQAARVSVPWDKFVNGESYRWRVRSRDTAANAIGIYSAWCEFTVRAVAFSSGPSSVPVETVPSSTVDPNSAEFPVEEPAGNEFIPGVDDQTPYTPTPDSGEVFTETSDDESDVHAAGSLEAAATVDTSNDFTAPTSTSPPSAAAEQACAAADGSTTSAPSGNYDCLAFDNGVSALSVPDPIAFPDSDFDAEAADAMASASSVAAPGTLRNIPLPQECAKVAYGQWVVSRYQACYRDRVFYSATDIVNGKVSVTGKAIYDLWRVARQSPRSETWDYHLILKNLYVTGTATAALAKPGYLKCMRGCTTRLNIAAVPAGRFESWAQISGTAYMPVGKNVKREDQAIMELNITRPDTSSLLTVRIHSNWVRCDRALKGSDVAGCVVPNFIPSLSYHKQGKYPDMANHIYAAQQSELPGKPGGVLNGQPGSEHALRRLYDDNLRDRNGRKACPSGLRDKVGAPKSTSCDEYPFRSTYQGAHTGDPYGNNPRTFKFCKFPEADADFGSKGYSRCFINAKQNSVGGSWIGVFYGDSSTGMRILDNDKFYVRINSN